MKFFSFLFLVLEAVGSVLCVYMSINKGFCHKSRTKNYPFPTSPAGDRELSFHYVNICMKIYHKIPTCFNLLKPHIFFRFVHSLTICPSNKCEMSLSLWDLPLFWAIEYFREIYLFKFHLFLLFLLYLKPLLSLLNGRKLTSIILHLLFYNCYTKKHNLVTVHESASCFH